jgi:hypothetical protein
MRNNVLAVLTVGTAMFLGCAESDYLSQGSAAPSETESNSSMSNTDPGVAAESGTAGTLPANQSAEERFNTLGSASAPSATVPANVATNATDASQNEVSSEAAPSTQNEQGTQVSPEPQTGDDANPDSVQPDL